MDDNNISAPDADLQAVFDHLALGTPLDPETAKRVHERDRKFDRKFSANMARSISAFPLSVSCGWNSLTHEVRCRFVCCREMGHY